MTMTDTISTGTLITADQIVEIATSVWSSMLEMTLYEVEGSHSPEEGDSTTATVHISGSWNGSVILSCSSSLARTTAAAMFQSAEDDLDDNEVADAFGELVNIVGGNLKCLLPEPSQLSLPTVSQGAAHVVTVPGADLVENVQMGCNGSQLNIAVWHRQDETDPNQHVELRRRTP